MYYEHITLGNFFAEQYQSLEQFIRKSLERTATVRDDLMTADILENILCASSMFHKRYVASSRRDTIILREVTKSPHRDRVGYNGMQRCDAK